MACDKTVYLVDKLTADNRIYHKACFRCHHCKGTLKVPFFTFFHPFFHIQLELVKIFVLFFLPFTQNIYPSLSIM